jgi:hypothetical protein
MGVKCGVFEFRIDGFVKSRKKLFSVIPAEAGIQSFQGILDSRLRGRDDLRDFLRTHQNWRVEEFARKFASYIDLF